MKYDSEIDEDHGFCPKCASTDTLSIESKMKRVCLRCEYFEQFESYPQLLVAWQTKIEARMMLKSETKTGPPVQPALEAQEVASLRKNMEWFIDVAESGVTRITIPTFYRDAFNSRLASQKVEQAHSSTTDVWNGIESAYTVFHLATRRSVAAALVEDWVAE